MDLNKKTFKCSKKLYWGRLGQNLSKAKKTLKKPTRPIQYKDKNIQNNINCSVIKKNASRERRTLVPIYPFVGMDFSFHLSICWNGFFLLSTGALF